MRTTLILLAILCGSTSAQPLYIEADALYTSAPVGRIEQGAVLVRDGKIAAVGPAADVAAPTNARRLRAAVVLPGLIDSHSLVGINGGYNDRADQDGFESTDAVGAEYRVLDSFNPQEKLLAHARSLGVTSVHVTPQPTAPIGGRSAVFKTSGNLADEMLLRSDVAVLFNLGEEPREAFAEKGPATRMAVAALIRQELHKARHWAAQDEAERQPDLGLQALASVLSGDSLALFSAHREDDIATALRIAKEFELRALINYGTESYLVSNALLAADATVILGPAMQRPTWQEKANSSVEVAALLQQAGVPFVFGSGFEAYVPKSRVLLWEIGVAVGNGLAVDRAIAAATIEPARLWGVEDRVGSLEQGKDADLVLFDGDPFEYTSHVTAVIVDGVVHEKKM